MDDQGPSASFRNQFAALSTGPAYSDADFEDEEQVKEEMVWREGEGPGGEAGGERELRKEVERAEEEWEGLYAVLNLPSTASPTEIRDRYRSLAILYHPDKQNRSQAPNLGPSSEADPSDPVASSINSSSHAQFARIQTASAILLDPHRRAVYDHFGSPGLEEHWEVAARVGSASSRRNHLWSSTGGDGEVAAGANKYDSPASLRAHYLLRAHTARQARLENLIRSKTDSSVTVDARAVFLPKSFFAEEVRAKVDHGWWARAGRVRVGQMGVRTSFEAPISKSTQLIWSGQMMARNGAGGGNVVGTVKHQFSSRFWVEAGSSILNPRIGTLKATYAHDQDTFATVNAVQVTPKAPPAISLTVGRKVMKGVTGFATLRSGFWELGPWGRGIAETMGRTDKAGLSLGLTTVGHAGSGFTVEGSSGLAPGSFGFGSDAQHASIDYSMKVLDGFNLKVGTSLGTAGPVSGFVNVERQVSESTKLGLGLTTTYPGGITMRIRFWRLGQKVTIPILLSQQLNLTLLFFSTVLPATSILTVHHLYIKPRRRRRAQDRIVELQSEHADYLAQRKAEAEDAVALMEEHVQRKVEQERFNDGLVIVSAHYGLSDCFTANGRRQLEGQEDKVVDVTIPVQALVNNGHLHIPGSRPKCNLLGFYDPCMGEKKTLHVEYIFKGKMHSCSVDDHASLRAPVRAHAVQDARNGSWDV